MTHDACIFLNMGTFRPFFVILVAAIVLSFFLTFLFKSFARIMFDRSVREDWGLDNEAKAKVLPV